MFNSVKKWLMLPGKDRWFFFQVFFLLGLVRAAILLVPFRWIALFLGEQGVESSNMIGSRQREISLRIGREILKAGRCTPWESRCLVQGITGKILLRRAGIESTLYLGVKKASQGVMTAHAWLRAGNMIIAGEKGREGCVSLSCFGNKSSLVESR